MALFWLIIFFTMSYMVHLVHHLQLYNVLTSEVFSHLLPSITRISSESTTFVTWINCLLRVNEWPALVYMRLSFYWWIKRLSQILYFCAHAYVFFVYTWRFSVLTPNSHVQLMTQMMADICQTNNVEQRSLFTLTCPIMHHKIERTAEKWTALMPCLSSSSSSSTQNWL